MQGTIFPGDWTFTIRGIYHPTLKEYGDDSFMFHYDYLYENEPEPRDAGLVHPEDR